MVMVLGAQKQIYYDKDQLLLYMFLIKEENIHLLYSCTHSPTPEVYFVQACSMRNSFFVIFLET